MEFTGLETLTINQEFNHLASTAQVTKTMRALEANGIHTVVFEAGEEARAYVLSLIPAGAVVYNPPSRTLEQIGLTVEIETAVRFQPLRSRLRTLDRVKDQAEYRKLVAGPDVVVGSVHAITEKGEALVSSATGSQLASEASGAGRVIWVAGTQKLVSTLDEGLRRIREYSYPLEDERTRQAYGQPSAIHKILVVNGEYSGRITLVLVKQNLGF